MAQRSTAVLFKSAYARRWRIIALIAAALVSVYDFETTRRGLDLILPGWFAFVAAIGVQVSIAASLLASRRIGWWRGALVAGCLLISLAGTAITFFSALGIPAQRQYDVRASVVSAESWASKVLVQFREEIVVVLEGEVARLAQRAKNEDDLGREGRSPGQGTFFKNLLEELGAQSAILAERRTNLQALENVVSRGVEGESFKKVERFITAVLARAQSAKSPIPPPVVTPPRERLSIPARLWLELRQGNMDALTAVGFATVLDGLLVSLLLLGRNPHRIVPARFGGRRRTTKEDYRAVQELLVMWSLHRFVCPNGDTALAPLLKHQTVREGRLTFRLKELPKSMSGFVALAAHEKLLEFSEGTPEDVCVAADRLTLWAKLVALLVAVESERRKGVLEEVEIDDAGEMVLRAAREVGEIESVEEWLRETIELNDIESRLGARGGRTATAQREGI